ncbi:MAG: hypothetical protein NTV62_02110 [Candidatus Gribaldobacteria bacterium]|nr:hypothetical protein [Candidatus Gribaldobacteria bacterium]
MEKSSNFTNIEWDPSPAEQNEMLQIKENLKHLFLSYRYEPTIRDWMKINEIINHVVKEKKEFMKEQNVRLKSNPIEKPKDEEERRKIGDILLKKSAILNHNFGEDSHEVMARFLLESGVNNPSKFLETTPSEKIGEYLRNL